jgi:hypothetical protein
VFTDAADPEATSVPLLLPVTVTPPWLPTVKLPCDTVSVALTMSSAFSAKGPTATPVTGALLAFSLTDSDAGVAAVGGSATGLTKLAALVHVVWLPSSSAQTTCSSTLWFSSDSASV